MFGVLVDVGEPLEGVRWPVERVQKQEVIEIWGLFLPYFVLLIDDHLFFLVELFRHKHYIISLTSITSNLNQHHSHSYQNMKTKGCEIPLISTELSLQEAMQLVGDNHTYQLSRLFIISVIILSTAILNNLVSLQDPPFPLFFLIASGAGQVICPVYLSLRTNTLTLAGSALLTAGVAPLHPILKTFAFLLLGMMSRGFFVGSLLYLNQIGGEKFRALAMMVIFGVWAGSQAVSSFQQWFNINQWITLYIFILLPMLVGSYLLLQKWQPSPPYLFLKKLYPELKQVLTQMSRQNQRPEPPYSILGQHDHQNSGYQPATYKDLLFRRILRKITIPLWALWIYRQYIYYTSYILIPEVSNHYGMVYILISLSETVAVIASYWIRLYIKRLNAIASALLAVLIVSLPCSFTTVEQQCKQGAQSCATKILYYIALTISRFGMSLLAIILVSYTLEVYPSNVRRMGFATCLGVSSAGSILMPWVNQVLISQEISGFLTFVLSTGAALYFIPRMEETHGQMKSQTLQQLQGSPETSLRNWALLNFHDQY